MGEFDRNAVPQEGTQKKQIILVVILGLVLVVVAGYPVLMKGPQQAMAGQSGAGGVPMPAATPDETAEQATNALKQDPTAMLLRRENSDESRFDKIPRNPFIMADAWRASITKVVEQVQPEITPVRTTDPTPFTPRATPQPVKIENYKLSSIIRVNDKLSAILNGHIVSAGMLVDGARIVEIREDRVVLQNANYADGPTSILTLEPKLR